MQRNEPGPAASANPSLHAACKLSLSGIVIGIVLAHAAPPARGDTWTVYADIGPTLATYESTYPTLCKRYNLGTSVQGRTLWAMRISDNVLNEEDEPECQYISTMHGDEVVGTKMCMNLIDYVLINYGTVQRVTDIVNNTELWIVPLMNPDGYDRSPRTRTNASGIDLNRDFPDPFTSPSNTPTGRATETQVIMNWGFGRSFTLAANFHGGAMVVNYPYDNNTTGSSVYTPSPDDDLFIVISEAFSSNNLPMWNSTTFFHGITNGADWYAVSGGMQDWGYRYMGCNSVTIELGNTKEPATSQIPSLWGDNRPAMLAYVETSLIGVRGIVTDATTGMPLAATVSVAGRGHDIYTDPDVGDYHRMLLPGNYSLNFSAAGHDALSVSNVAVLSGPATRLDVALGAPAHVLYPNGGETLQAGIASMVSWTGSATAQFHVQYTENYGAVNQVSDGFEGAALDPAYTTGGNANWGVAAGTFHGGTKAAKAGTVSHNQQTWMARTVGGGLLSFWYRVSSELNYDFLDFTIDGNLQVHVSGNGSWAQYSTVLAAGSHELKWTYSKDGSVSNNSDTAWVDDLQVSQDATAWNDISALTGVGVTSLLWTPPNAGSNRKVRVQAYYPGGAYGLWDESDATFSVSPAPTCLKGDMNNDGTLDGRDVQRFVDALLAGASAMDVCRGDYTGNGLLEPNDTSGFAGALLGS